MNKVIRLDKIRRQKGYKNGWLYHKCKEQGLLEEYKKYKNPSPDFHKKTFGNEGVKMSFGKYKGVPMDEIWENDRDYLLYVYKQDWIKRKEESMYLEQLFIENDISYNRDVR